MTVCPAYNSSGDTGPVLLFLHGVGGDKTVFAPQLAHFSSRFRAVAWDAPGYGQSPPPSEMTFANLADGVAALLDHLEVETAIVVGHSLGGMVAQEFAYRYPARLRALVLSGTSPAFGNPSGDWQQKFLAARLAPLDAGQTMADLAPALVAGMLGDAPDPEGVETTTSAMSRVPENTYRAAMKMLVTFDRRKELAGIRVPTLVIAGEKDKNAPAGMMERMAAKISGAHYYLMPGAGHLANLEQPADFNAVVDGFLTDKTIEPI